jgi:hypothetical protein
VKTGLFFCAKKYILPFYQKTLARDVALYRIVQAVRAKTSKK